MVLMVLSGPLHAIGRSIIVLCHLHCMHISNYNSHAVPSEATKLATTEHSNPPMGMLLIVAHTSTITPSLTEYESCARASDTTAFEMKESNKDTIRVVTNTILKKVVYQRRGGGGIFSRVMIFFSNIHPFNTQLF